MLNVLVVDDEFPAREELVCLLEEIGGVRVVDTCDDGEEALARLEQVKVEVVFLDIRMPSVDGLTVAKRVMNLPRPPRIVFTTGYSEYAARAFDLDAADYLVKPYEKERLERTIAKLRAMVKGKAPDPAWITEDKQVSRKLPVWTNDRLLLLDVGDIFFAKADGKRNTLLATQRGNYNTAATLHELEEKLADAGFLRTHKSYIVNTAKVEEVIPWFNNTYLLVLKDCPVKDIPVARHYIAAFNERLSIKS